MTKNAKANTCTNDHVLIMLFQVGVNVSPSHGFSVLVRAEAPGKASIKVCVQLEQTHASNTSLSDHLTDEIQIQVTLKG